MTTKESTQKGRLEEWERLIQRMAANAQDLAHLEAARARLEGMLNEAREAAAQQAAHTAGKQESTQKLKVLQVEGERLATVLRGAVKQHYGIRSEKLAEFGLKPFRGRKKNDGLGARGGKSPEPQPSTPPANESHEPAR
jgi:septal ring factor EnvC (AmiA/AmiB activator)